MHFKRVVNPVSPLVSVKHMKIPEQAECGRRSSGTHLESLS